MFKLTKRRRFILTSLLLTGGLFLIQQGVVNSRYFAIGILSFVSLVLSLWSLGIPLSSRVWLFSWVLPFCFTVSVSLFYFLLPSSLLSLVPILLLYLVGMYVLLLSENIFFVTSIRTIQLYRSASAVSFLLTLLTAFLLYDTILSFRLIYYFNIAIVWLVSFLLILHSCWVSRLDEGISNKLLEYSFILSWCVSTTALAISFWPVTITQGSLLLTANLYVLIGTAQAKLNDRLFKKVVREYLVIGLTVVLVMVISTHWG